MRRPAPGPMLAGEDSFLDIIANLVGVLVILVAVVGTQARTLILQGAQEPHVDATWPALETAADQARQAAAVVAAEIEELERAIRSERARATTLAAMRHERLVGLELARRALDERAATLDERRREQLRAQAELAELENDVDRLVRQVSLAERASEPETVIIPHYPAPIARTVFSDEIHFRLERGRVTYVPLDELAQIMRQEWKVKAEKLSRVARTQEVVGPVGEFRLHYELVAETVHVASPHGQLAQTQVKLDHFQIIPTRAGLGETIESAFQAGSDWQDRLSRLTPEKTTVSIWVYPDSFAEYNALRQWLRARGFQTASWPLSADRHISGSPDGLRTSAQ